MATFSETGSYSGHLRLRMEVVVGEPGASTTSVNVRLRVWVGTDGWNINDGQRVGFSGWKSGGNDFMNDLTSGEKLVIDRDWSHSVGNSDSVHSFSATLSGNNATGSSPSVSTSFRVLGRPGSAPSQPRSLSVSSIRSTGAMFQWSPPLDNGGLAISEYHLQYRKDTEDNYTVIENISNSEREVTSSFDRNTVYRWRVRAVNSAGLGDLNQGDDFRTDREHPSVGTPVEVDNLEATSARILWAIGDNGGAATEKSEVIVSTSSNRASTGSYVHNAESDVITSRNVTGLTRATKYYYWIRIYNGKYWSDWTQTRDFTTDPTEPKTRAVLTVVADGPTAALSSWTWSGDDGGRAITGYDWQFSTSSDFTTDVVNVSTTNLSRTQTGLTPATQYFFRVRPKNTVGAGPWSATRSLIAPQGVKRWTGTTWAPVPIYYWDGTDWAVPTSIKGRSGSGWVEAS